MKSCARSDSRYGLLRTRAKTYGGLTGREPTPKRPNWLRRKLLFLLVYLVDLTGPESNLLFEVLEDWEHQLAQLDPQGLGVRDDKPKP